MNIILVKRFDIIVTFYVHCLSLDCLDFPHIIDIMPSFSFDLSMSYTFCRPVSVPGYRAGKLLLLARPGYHSTEAADSLQAAVAGWVCV